MSFFLANPTGRILNRFAKDQNQIDETLPLTLYIFLESFIYCLAAIVLVCISIPWLILIMPILVGLFFYLRETYLKSTREIKRIEAITRSPLYSDFSATLDGLVTLKAFQLRERISYLFQYQLDQNGQVFFSFLMVARWLGFRLDIETTIILVAVSFLSVILRNSVDIGLIGFTLTYTMALSGLFQWAVRLSVEAETQMTAVERVLEYAQLPGEPGYESTLDKFTSASDPVAVSKTPNNAEEVIKGGDVEFQKVTVTYREDLDPVLNQLSLFIKGGQKVGICGRTGCGKSSTLLALLRLNLVTNGDILVNGKSLLAMSLEDSRSLITIIPQEPHLFSGTVRFNLDPFQLYSDLEIWSALKDAHIADALKPSASQSEEGKDTVVTNNHRTGLDTMVEEGGKNFSVGQRQLLSLARAILRKSPVVLMDEVTASIDFQTDRLIQETIRTSPALKQATIITIAHRLRTISDSDVIVVMDAGKVAEADTPKVLLTREQSLFRLLAEQSGEYDEICRIAGTVKDN
jgi:ABC-type multidrug transport system fused ATPase/permease subunit